MGELTWFPDIRAHVKYLRELNVSVQFPFAASFPIK